MSTTTSMPTSHSTSLHASEQLLPSEVTAKSETWLTRARNYPVFSRTWFRYRAQAWIGIMIIANLLIFGMLWMTGPEFRKGVAVFVPLTLCGTSLHLLGPAIATWIRSRAYTGKKELVCLTTSLLFGAACSYAVFIGVSHLTQYLVLGASHVEVTASVSARAQKQEPHAADSAASNPKPAEPIVDGKQDKTEYLAERSALLEQVGQVLGFVVKAGLICYIAGIVDLWYFFRQKKRLLEVMREQELKMAQDARREAQLRLSVLAAQVEPHFLFNTLAGVRSAILTEPQRATAIIDHLVDYLRATIPHLRDDGASAQARLKQQMEAASAYLALMQSRIPRLSFSVDCEVADAVLPPLMLISLVENAVKHGVEPKVGPVHIAVSAKISHSEGNPMLQVTVADNGVGFAPVSSGEGIGLANIHERLASMYGKHASLVLKARAEGGVAATISLPLET